MTTARDGLAVGVVGDRMYAVGGDGVGADPYTTDVTGVDYLSSMEAYDLVPKSWSSN